MTLTELSYIVALAQEQHFGRAAERCHVSQPTLSIAIKEAGGVKLEVTLCSSGCKNGVQITPLGERIVTMAGGVLASDCGHQRCGRRRSRNSCRGSLGAGHPAYRRALFAIPQFIPLLAKTAGQLSLFVEEGSQESLTLKLRNGELDVILWSQHR